MLVDIISAFELHSSVQLSQLTLELDLKAGELEFDSLQSFPEGLVVVRDLLLGSLAEGEREVGVGLLAVVVGPDSVHP